MKRGFTLIELLIASSIFIIVMIMAMAVFSWAASYNIKLHEMRNASQDNWAAASIISKDIRLANGSLALNVRANASAVSPTSNPIGEIALLNCLSRSGASCRLIPETRGDRATVLNSITSNSDSRYNKYNFEDGITLASDSRANAMLVVMKDQEKIVFYINVLNTDSVNYTLYRYESSLTGNAFNLATLPYSVNWKKINNDNNVSLRAIFAGYAAPKSGRIQQPYVEMLLRAESWNYDATAERYRSRFDLKTTVETRDYNPA